MKSPIRSCSTPGASRPRHETRDRAGRVVGVERTEDQVTGEGRLHGDVGRFLVTNFADHHDVRRLTQNRTERGREVETDVAVHLHLVDARHLVFDRVFDRDDLAVGRIHLPEAGVKRGRFT